MIQLRGAGAAPFYPFLMGKYICQLQPTAKRRLKKHWVKLFLMPYLEETPVDILRGFCDWFLLFSGQNPVLRIFAMVDSDRRQRHLRIRYWSWLGQWIKPPHQFLTSVFLSDGRIEADCPELDGLPVADLHLLPDKFVIFLPGRTYCYDFVGSEMEGILYDDDGTHLHPSLQYNIKDRKCTH